MQIAAIGLPLFVGGTLATIFLFWRARRSAIGWGAGLLSWIVFFVGAMVGEFVSHFLFPSYFSTLGDNPSQVIGTTLAFFLSFVVNPALWLYFRHRSRSKTVDQPIA